MIGRIWRGGVILAYALIFRAYKALMPPRLTDGFGRILVFSTGGIGDTLSDTPAIRAVREAFPRAQLDVVVDRRRLELFTGNTDVNRVIPYKKNPIQFIKFWFEVGGRYDLSIVLRANDPDIFPLAYVASRQVLANPERTRFPFLVTRPHKDPAWKKRHGVQQTNDVVANIGAVARDPRIVLAVQREEREEIIRRMDRDGLAPRRTVVIMCGGSGRQYYREWPAANFARLLDLLAERRSEIQPVLIGGRNVTDKAREILGACRKAKPRNWADETSLRQTAALLSVTRAFVTTDTGIMHIGYAVQCPTVALLHCLIPESQVGPYGYDPNRYRVIELQPPGGAPCGTELKLESIEPETVLEKLEQLLELNP